MNSYEKIYSLITEEKPKPLKTGKKLATAEKHSKYKELLSQGKVGPAVAAAYKAGTYDPNKDYSAENRQMMK
jgi:hypothetical protein